MNIDCIDRWKMRSHNQQSAISQEMLTPYELYKNQYSNSRSSLESNQKQSFLENLIFFTASEKSNSIRSTLHFHNTLLFFLSNTKTLGRHAPC